MFLARWFHIELPYIGFKLVAASIAYFNLFCTLLHCTSAQLNKATSLSTTSCFEKLENLRTDSGDTEMSSDRGGGVGIGVFRDTYV